MLDTSHQFILVRGIVVYKSLNNKIQEFNTYGLKPGYSFFNAGNYTLMNSVVIDVVIEIKLLSTQAKRFCLLLLAHIKH